MKKKILKALEDKDFSELFKKGGLSLFLRIGGQVMGFLMSFVVAHYFGAKGLGNYVLAIVILRIFIAAKILRLDQDEKRLSLIHI